MCRKYTTHCTAAKDKRHRQAQIKKIHCVCFAAAAAGLFPPLPLVSVVVSLCVCLCDRRFVCRCCLIFVLLSICPSTCLSCLLFAYVPRVLSAVAALSPFLVFVPVSLACLCDPRLFAVAVSFPFLSGFCLPTLPCLSIGLHNFLPACLPVGSTFPLAMIPYLLTSSHLSFLLVLVVCCLPVYSPVSPRFVCRGCLVSVLVPLVCQGLLPDKIHEPLGFLDPEDRGQ